MNDQPFSSLPSSIQNLNFQPNFVHYQAPPQKLIEQSLALGQGTLTNTGAFVIYTGKFTGRSPKDKFIVKDALTEKTVNWNEFNQPMDTFYFDRLYQKMITYFSHKPVWIREAYACADTRYRLNLTVVTETPWANLFAYNLFLRPQEKKESGSQNWLLIHAPGFTADPDTDGTRKENFAAIDFSRKMVLIGGTAYTGEMKKAVFTVLNYLLPVQSNVLPMHCSANVGSKGDTALFFGLSGTGKTTLSTEGERSLVGDDEHGWTEDGIFNFEGGCYAKCIHLSKEGEPQIYAAIKQGALLENVGYFPDTNIVDFSNQTITENTRVSYPLTYVENAYLPSTAAMPKNIFFLTCDAYGVLPPISRLTIEQALYHFLCGYTAKIAGTEAGITEPKSTFSPCFGAPFLPLPPAAYADRLGVNIQKHRVKVWLVNTGWTGGPYGKGKRIKLSHTRAMIQAALNGIFDTAGFTTDTVFGLSFPLTCPSVPSCVLEPSATWEDAAAYNSIATALKSQLDSHYAKYSEEAARQ